MMMIKFLTLLGFLLAGTAEACSLSKTNSWFWSKEQLIANTSKILLVKVVNSKRVNPKTRGKRGWAYSFEVVEVLKGSPAKVLTLQDFEGPDSGANQESGPRSYYDSACKPAVGFQPGHSYLIFQDSFHPFGYQEVKSSEDSWLAEARGYLRKK